MAHKAKGKTKNMALLKWYDDNQDNQDNIFNPTPIKQVTSVQSGSWQPAQSGANMSIADDSTPQQSNGGIFNTKPDQSSQPQSSQNYLLSDQKAVVDQQKRQRDAEIEAARQQAAEQAAARKRAANAAAVSQQLAQGDAQDIHGQKIDVNAAKNDDGWKKYYDEAFKREQDSLDFWGRLMDGGQASKRAEVIARSRYAGDLLNSAYDDNGGIRDANAAIKARGVTAYNSALASDGVTRAQALSRAIGADKDNKDRNLLDQIKSAINAEKQMSIYDAIFGVDDGTKTDINDLGRFGGGLLQGFGTMLPIGAKEVTEAATGHGTNYDTGFEEDLNGLQRGGRAISGALNVVTPFVGGSGRLLDSLATKVAQGTATAVEKTLLQQMRRNILLPAIEQGGIGAAQAGGEYFGNGNTLTNENGNIDIDKLKRFAAETGQAGALGFAGGALTSGAAVGVNRLRRNGVDMPTLTPGELAELEMGTTDSGASQLSNLQAAERAGARTGAVEGSEIPKIEADGIVRAVDDMKPVSLEDRARIERQADGIANAPDITRVDGGNIDPTLANRAELEASAAPLEAESSSQLIDQNPTAPAALNADGIATPDVQAREMPLPENAAAIKQSEAPTVDNSVPVADGVIESGQSVPGATSSTDTVRQLQDSRAGKSQAEEAAINQRLQQLTDEIPRIQEVPDPLESLKQEALKYKSAEEFVRAQGSPLYRGGHTYDQSLVTDRGVSTATSKENAQWFAGGYGPDAAKSGKTIEKLYLKPDSKILSLNDVPKDVLDGFKKLNSGNTTLNEELALVNYARKQGYDAIDLAPWGEAEVRVINKDAIRTKQQLADLYNQAHTQPTPKVEAPTPQAQKPQYKNASRGGDTIYNDLPDGLAPVEKSKIPKVPNDDAISMKDLANRTVTGSAKPEDLKARLADAVGLSKDANSSMAELVDNAKLSDSHKRMLTDKYSKLEQVIERQSEIQKENRKLVAKDNLNSVDSSKTREWSSLERQKGELQRDISNIIRLVDSRKSLGNKAAYAIENIVSAKNANQLASAPGIERNLLQDTMATTSSFVRNPIRTLRSMPNGGIPLKSAAKSAVGNWKSMKNSPKTVTSLYKDTVGNVYNTAMTPTTAIANMRSQSIREAIAEMGLRSTGKKPTRQEVINYSRTLDGNAETLTNILSGVANSMTNRHQANKAIKAYQELVQTGSVQSRRALEKLAERQTTLAQKLIKGFEKDGTPAQRIGSALAEAVLPYVRVATNATINGAYRLVPNRSVIDEVLSSVRSKPENFMRIIQNKAVDYGLIGTVVGMVGSGAITYNNGDEVDKPRGVSIKVGDNQFVPIRATDAETEIASILTAMNIVSGKSDPAEALNIMSGSLPYISSTDNLVTAGQSFLNGDNEQGDGGYAAKAYGVGQAKSLVPFSNNGIQPWVARNKGESLNAKTVYDPNILKWIGNSVGSSYDSKFRDSLPDSRDAAGRVRTVDNQGAVINKTINDANTKKYNSAISRLVDYGKKAGLGEGVKDMFSTYDSGKNNNFKSVQDAITFLDTDGGKPDNAKKLEKNDKLADLSRQIRDGFFGDTGSELLTIDGKELKSDASVPSVAGTKNSKLPISMQSIKNAVAQTDLSKEDWAKLNDISSKKQELYNRRKAKEITYEQEQAEKLKLSNDEAGILSNSKSYQKMAGLFSELDQSGFFNPDGLGSTKSGQTYLWNSLNALLGSKGSTPAAEYAKNYSKKGFTPWSFGKRGTGRTSNAGGNLEGGKGVQWTPVKARQLASVKGAQFTPFKAKIKLENSVKRDKTQNYSNRSF